MQFFLKAHQEELILNSVGVDYMIFLAPFKDHSAAGQSGNMIEYWRCKLSLDEIPAYEV
jgi:hypothetical protein